jgi:lipoprotein Spr
MPNIHAERARALVGTRFRVQGRAPFGLDCVGLVVAAYDIAVDEVRRDYPLRGNSAHEMRDNIARYFRKVPEPQLRPGDLLLMAINNDQLHLGIRTEQGFVHAHAGIRRVVETPGPPSWPVLGVYRRKVR